MSGPRQDASPFGTGDLWEVLRTPIEVPQVTLPVPAPEVSESTVDKRKLYDMGVRYIAPPTWMLVTLNDAGEIVPARALIRLAGECRDLGDDPDRGK